MQSNQSQKCRRPINAERPFPWRCRHCGQDQVFLMTISYNAEVRHEGRLHTITIPDLELPVCKACGKKVFTEAVDDQILAAFQSQFLLLPPNELSSALEPINASQYDAG